MKTKQSKFLTGLVAVLMIMLFAVPSVMAQEPQGDGGEGQHKLRGVRILLVIAAEQLGMTPRELLAELRAEDGRTIADVANEKGVDPDTIVEAVAQKASERLAQAVEKGKITQEEADEKLATLRERVTEAINKPLPANRGGGQSKLRGARIVFRTAAEVIGLTPRELADELREADDRTIADVANEHGVDPNDIVEAVVQKAAERLAKAVEKGKITQEEADERLNTIREKTTELINTPFQLPQRDPKPQDDPNNG
jgi:transposase-like protein